MKRMIFALIFALIFDISAFGQNIKSFCAKIEVTGGNIVNAGEPMSFSANFTGKIRSSPGLFRRAQEIRNLDDCAIIKGKVSGKNKKPQR